MNENGLHDRYQVPPGNKEAEFVDEDMKVLVNKRGITDLETLQIAEEKALAFAYANLIARMNMNDAMTSEFIKAIHAAIFSDLFEWGGRWRTVQISKPGAIWPPPAFIEKAMQEYESTCLVKYPGQQLTDDDTFCRAIGEIQGEFLAIHRFVRGMPARSNS